MTEDKTELRQRAISAAGIILVLLGLTWLGYRASPIISLRMCLAAPDLFDGRVVSFGAETRLDKIVPGGFVLRQSDLTLPVKGDPGSARPGDYISLTGIFHASGFLDLEGLYVAKGRRTKIIVSIFPALLVIGLLFKTYGLDRRRLALRKRN